MAYKVFIALYFLVTLWSILVIIYYGRRSTKSISWVLVVIVFPIAGAILYYLFGVNRRKFKFFRSKEFERRRKIRSFIPDSYISHKYEFDSHTLSDHVAKLIMANAQSIPLKGNDIEVLHDGEPTFNAIFEEMEKAKNFIHVQYYILEEGKLLRKMIELFEQKIKEGVKIRVIYDSFGSYWMRGRLRKKFEKIGAKIYPMMPIRFGNLLFSLNYRNHRKIVIVDGKVAFTGGINVSDKYIKAENELGKWKDTHLKMVGPIVNGLHLVFLKDYFFANKEDGFKPENYLFEQDEVGNVTAQVVAGGPDSEQPVIMQQYIAMVSRAKDFIYISNPYFIPGEAFMQAIKIAAMQGVDVNLLVPNKSDSIAAKFAMFSQFEELLNIGVNIYLRSDFSHSKILMVDDDVTSIGTGNFDYRSFEHNYETNILIYDHEITVSLKSELEKLCDRAKNMDLEEFKKRPRWHKFLEGLAKFFKPLL